MCMHVRVRVHVCGFVCLHRDGNVLAARDLVGMLGRLPVCVWVCVCVCVCVCVLARMRERGGQAGSSPRTHHRDLRRDLCCAMTNRIAGQEPAGTARN